MGKHKPGNIHMYDMFRNSSEPWSPYLKGNLVLFSFPFVWVDGWGGRCGVLSGKGNLVTLASSGIIILRDLIFKLLEIRKEDQLL